MNCQEVQHHLVELIYDELPPGRRESIEAHLESCPHCRGEHEALRQARVSLDVLNSDVAAPALDVRRLFHAAAQRGQRQRRQWRRAAVVASAVAGIALLLSALRLEVENGRAAITWGEAPARIPDRNAHDGSNLRHDTGRDALSRHVDSLAERVAGQERDLHELAQRMQTIGELAQLATRELLSVDQRHSEELARLRSAVDRLGRSTTAAVEELREQNDLRWKLTVHELGRRPGLEEISVETQVPGE